MVKAIGVVLLASLVHSSLGFAQAQQRKKIARVGYLWHGFPPPQSAPPRAFYQGLREVGYIEGKNLIVEYRYSEGDPKRFRDLAGELVSSNVDLIVATSTAAIRAARQVTTTIPIVIFSAGDPVSSEFIDSLARPGGNVTGLTGVFPAFSGKLLQRWIGKPAEISVGMSNDGGKRLFNLMSDRLSHRPLSVRSSMFSVSPL